MSELWTIYASKDTHFNSYSLNIDLDPLGHERLLSDLIDPEDAFLMKLKQITVQPYAGF